MTKEEQAIAYIKQFRELDKRLYDTAPKETIASLMAKKCLEYWDMAIEALEQDNDVLISRQAVLDLIADNDLSMGQVVKAIHLLPAVKPQD